MGNVYSVYIDEDFPTVISVSLDPVALTWSHLINTALVLFRSRGDAATTLTQRAYILAQLAGYMAEHQHLPSAITPQIWRSFRQQIDRAFREGNSQGKSRRQKTRASQWRTIWWAMEHLARSGNIESNPIPPGQPKRDEHGNVYMSFSEGRDSKARPRIIPSPDEITALIAALPQVYQDLTLICIGTAGRISEVLRMIRQWSPTSGVRMKNGSVETVAGKGKQKLVDLLLPDEIAPLVRRLKAAGMLDHHGRQLNGKAFNGYLKRAAVKAGLDLSVHPHLMRHIAASYEFQLLTENGEGPDARLAVSERLNHESPQTGRIYIHPVGLSAQESAVRRTVVILNRVKGDQQ